MHACIAASFFPLKRHYWLVNWAIHPGIWIVPQQYGLQHEKSPRAWRTWSKMFQHFNLRFTTCKLGPSLAKFWYLSPILWCTSDVFRAEKFSSEAYWSLALGPSGYKGFDEAVWLSKPPRYVCLYHRFIQCWHKVISLFKTFCSPMHKMIFAMKITVILFSWDSILALLKTFIDSFDLPITLSIVPYMLISILAGLSEPPPKCEFIFGLNRIVFKPVLTFWGLSNQHLVCCKNAL